MFLFTFATTRERVQPVPEQKTSTGRDLLDLVKNIPWLVLCLLGILQVCFVSIRGAAIIFYFKYYFGDIGAVALFLLVGAIMSLLGTFLIQYVTPYTGRKNAFIGLMLLSTVALVASYWVTPDQLGLLYAYNIVYCLLTGPTSALLWAMFADAADYSEWKTGRRATGLVFSASGMSNKFGWVIGGALAATLLAVYGFQANVVQTEHAQQGIRILMAIAPAVGTLLCGLGMMGYRLNEAKMQIIHAELASSAQRTMREREVQFGYFDDANKEYVITRPDTPKSWSNYLGSTEYGAIITNNAGGYSFYKSAAQGRFMRLRFNALPLDQPGRYIYLHDHDSADFWSASWQPVGKPSTQYKSVCRHGTAYTVISSEYGGIRPETTYFVPLGRDFECWRVRLTNFGGKPRRLSAFTYVEYAGNWSAIDDLINLQYSQHIVKMAVEGGIIDHGTNVNIPPRPDDFEEADQGRHTFLALVGADVSGYDTDRDAFLGPYRSYAKPIAVERGKCTNSLAVGDNGCGVLQTRIQLKPGETKEFLVLMGVGTAK